MERGTCEFENKQPHRRRAPWRAIVLGTVALIAWWFGAEVASAEASQEEGGSEGVDLVDSVLAVAEPAATDVVRAVVDPLPDVVAEPVTEVVNALPEPAQPAIEPVPAVAQVVADVQATTNPLVGQTVSALQATVQPTTAATMAAVQGTVQPTTGAVLATVQGAAQPTTGPVLAAVQGGPIVPPLSLPPVIADLSLSTIPVEAVEAIAPLRQPLAAMVSAPPALATITAWLGALRPAVDGPQRWNRPSPAAAVSSDLPAGQASPRPYPRPTAGMPPGGSGGSGLPDLGPALSILVAAATWAAAELGMRLRGLTTVPIGIAAFRPSFTPD